MLATGYLNDLHVYDSANMMWTDLSVAVIGIPPVAREAHGFTCTGDKLYVHAGWAGHGEARRSASVRIENWMGLCTCAVFILTKGNVGWKVRSRASVRVGR